MPRCNPEVPLECWKELAQKCHKSAIKHLCVIVQAVKPAHVHVLASPCQRGYQGDSELSWPSSASAGLLSDQWEVEKETGWNGSGQGVFPEACNVLDPNPLSWAVQSSFWLLVSSQFCAVSQCFSTPPINLENMFPLNFNARTKKVDDHSSTFPCMLQVSQEWINVDCIYIRLEGDNARHRVKDTSTKLSDALALGNDSDCLLYFVFSSRFQYFMFCGLIHVHYL